MTSQAKIEANRRNAAKSTGPRTSQGKARAALNALGHGLYARTIVLPGEDAAGFAALRDDFVARLKPEGAVESHLVARLAALFWRQDRIARVEAGLLATALEAGDGGVDGGVDGGIGGDNEGDGGFAMPDPIARWDRLGRIETRLALAFERTLARFHDIRERRRAVERNAAYAAERIAEREEARRKAELREAKLKVAERQVMDRIEALSRQSARAAGRTPPTAPGSAPPIVSRAATRPKPAGGPGVEALLSGTGTAALMAAAAAPRPTGR